MDMFIPINKVNEYLKVIKNYQPKRTTIEVAVENLTDEQMKMLMGDESKHICEKVKIVKCE